MLIAGGVQLARPSDSEHLTPLTMARERGYAALEAALVAADDPSRRPTKAEALSAVRSATERGDATALAHALRDGGGRSLDEAGIRDPIRSADAAGADEVVRLLRAHFVLR